MKNLRIVLVGVIASLFLMTLSISCDTDKGADIQTIEKDDIQKLDKGEIGDDDI